MIDELTRELSEMITGIERGDPFHPREVQDMVDRLMMEGEFGKAQRLAGMKVNWDR